jgi:two-component system, NarL family, sensor kinase
VLRRPKRRGSVAGAVVQFAVAGVAVAALVGAAGAYVLRDLGTNRAISEARRVTELTGRAVVQPAVTDDLLSGDASAIASVDRVVRRHVLRQDVLRVKIWSADGTILYSDEPRLIGSRFTLASEDRAALRRGRADAEVSNLNRPENRYERAPGKVLEVYMGLRTPSGAPVLFEEYLAYDAIAGTGRSIWLDSAPVLIGALLLVAAVQVPLAWSMARRLRADQRERERLLQRAVEASDAERRTIAAGLHDGVVQELAGLAFRLAGAAERADGRCGHRPVLGSTASALRGSIRQLRTLLLEIHPPNLADTGLEPALEDLAAPLREQGIDVDVDVRASLADQAQERLVFRTAQEALRNAGKHARATHVAVRLERSDGGVELIVADDGAGFGAADVERRRADGHVGLALLADAARDAGCRLDVDSERGAGTQVRLWVPDR